MITKFMGGVGGEGQDKASWLGYNKAYRLKKLIFLTSGSLGI